MPMGRKCGSDYQRAQPATIAKRIRRSRAPSSGPGTFFAAQFSAGCTTNISGFDLRQAQRWRFDRAIALWLPNQSNSTLVRTSLQAIIARADQSPAGMSLTLYIGGSSIILRIQRVKLLIEPVLGGN